MSTQRYISTSFWDDKWIRSLDPSERYLYMYLLTNTLTTISGIYRITLDRIAYDTGYDERTLSPMLKRFSEARKAYLFEDEYMILPSWPKHQRWETKETIKKGIDADLEKIPEKVKKYSVSVGYLYPIPNIPVPTELFYSDTDTDTDTDTDIHSEPAQAPIPLEAYTFANLLYTLHRDKIDQGYRKTDADLRRWAIDIERIYRIDKRTWTDIELAILWIKTPGQFWAANIMSGKKLREKFPTIWAQMNTKKPGPVLPVHTRKTMLED